MNIVHKIVVVLINGYFYVGTWVGAIIGSVMYPVAYGYKYAQAHIAQIDAMRAAERTQRHM